MEWGFVSYDVFSEKVFVYQLVFQLWQCRVRKCKCVSM